MKNRAGSCFAQDPTKSHQQSWGFAPSRPVPSSAQWITVPGLNWWFHSRLPYGHIFSQPIEKKKNVPVCTGTLWMSWRWITHFGGCGRALPELTATSPSGTSSSLQEVTRQKPLLQVAGNKVVLEGHRLTRGDNWKSLRCNKLLAEGDSREKSGWEVIYT